MKKSGNMYLDSEDLIIYFLAVIALVVLVGMGFFNAGRSAGIDFMLNLTDSGYICEPITTTTAGDTNL